ncbi:MAG: hypothetical protein AB7J40_05945 [Candidatus Altimarinota bacterium]
MISAVHKPLVIGYDGKSSPDFFVTNNTHHYPQALGLHHDTLASNDFSNKALVRYLDYYGIDTVFSSRLARLTKEMRHRALVFLFHPHEDEKTGTAEFIQNIRGRLVVMLYSDFDPLRNSPRFPGFSSIHVLEDGLYGVDKYQGFNELIRFLVERLVSQRVV